MKRVMTPLVALLWAGALIAATKTATFSVKGWTCGSCAASTRIALKKVDGVKDVKTDLEQAEVVVIYDDTKVVPDQMLQAIDKLGYKAAVKSAASSSTNSPRSQKDAAVSAPAAPEPVSFFEVPLECGAAEGLGCGSASKPILKALGRDPRIQDAKVNYPGTVLAVVWNNPADALSGSSSVETAFKERDLETSLLRGTARDKALKEYESGSWYGAADVDRLSEREAQVIASRLVNRAKAHLDLPPAKLAALTTDLSGGIATVLMRDKGEECARDPLEELTKIARKHLNEQQLAELRKAAEEGVGALPGEAK